MRLHTVYARFFRSLNYDYLRAAHSNYQPHPWDSTPTSGEYPFVRLRLERDITTIVGANESGKSQLLSAIARGLTGEGIERGDFCRYSQFFSTDSGLVKPEFGLTFTDLSDAERAAASQISGTEIPPADITAISLFRMNATPQLRVYLHTKPGPIAGPWHVKKPSVLSDAFRMPRAFEIDADIPLPDSVPLAYLATGKVDESLVADEYRRRWDRAADSFVNWFSNAQTITDTAPSIASALGGDAAPDDRALSEYKLADDLLIRVVGLERDLFKELRRAARVKTSHGYADGIVERINAQIATRLNFPHWWSQDSSFELFVGHTESDLKFMIRDRTGTTYSFGERSAGLKYFLSYFVQYQSHEPRADGLPEILLMDEPDAFLSSSGQQDLLRLFEAFAQPENPETPPIQVVYVTHSPFLIDKNHAERVRVLEKGENDEGTRVVANASRNHYEPLRSAFGSFVGETAFIGTCNLLLEGTSDQILLAGISSWLTRTGRAATTQRLDLNTLTLVPAGSASQIPYLAYLARGRDVDRPAVIVLLDGDSAGDEARAALSRGGPRGKQLVNPEYVLQLSDAELDLASDNPAGVSGIEDLIPASIAIAAAQAYCSEFAPAVAPKFAPSPSEVFAAKKDTIRGLEVLLAQASGDSAHLDKIGFARCLLSVLPQHESTADGERLASNFIALLAALTRRQRQADRDTREEKVRTRVNRERRRFMADHPDAARREEVTLLVETIERQLDTSPEADEVRRTMSAWQRRYQLNEDPRSLVEDYPGFLRALDGLAYAGVQQAQENPL